MLYACNEQFGNAQVDETCLIYDASGQDGLDSCVLGLGVSKNGTLRW